MSGWAKKRFWKSAEVSASGDGFTVTLDGRALKTPGKALLVVPTEALAQIIADEWQAQGEFITPDTMPATRAANSAIDKISGQKSSVAAFLAEYGDSDLVCYRAASPEALVAREAAVWDPLIDWVAHRYGVRPVTRIGVIHAPQPKALLDSFRPDIERLSSFELAAFHDLVAFSGSLIIGLAVIDRFDAPDSLWRASRLEEDWQIEQWGEDEEAAVQSEGRRQAFLAAARFYFALQS